MTTGTRNTWILTGLIGLLPLVVLVGACSETEETAAEVAGQRPDIPEQQFFDYVFTETSAGVTQWILESDEMQKFSGQRDVQFTVVKMDFFNDGVHFSTLTSDSGSGNMQVRDVHVWGNVVLLKDNGDMLETEELFFDNKNELIHNEIFNRMTTIDDVVTGFGLEATPDLEYIKIKNKMRGDVADKAAAESDRR
jgi:LPS export ABC transporter protein LptC